MNTQELSDLDGPTVTLTCNQVKKTGTTVQFAKQTGATLFGGVLNQTEWDAYNKGTPVMLAVTYCFQDEITRKSYVKHICLKQYANGTLVGCRKNND
jgi:hypothetical protein